MGVIIYTKENILLMITQNDSHMTSIPAKAKHIKSMPFSKCRVSYFKAMVFLKKAKRLKKTKKSIKKWIKISIKNKKKAIKYKK